jgi:C4-dicarboxylate-specific signal transduction histidine kinase
VADTNRIHDIEQMAVLFVQRQKRRLFYTIAGTTIAALLALLLIAYSYMYSRNAFQQAASAQQRVTVLEERKAQLETEIESRTAQLKALIDTVQKASSSPSPAVNQALQEATKEVAKGSRLIYLQFRGSLSRDTMRGLQAILQERKYSAPGIERVAGNYSSEVRYFRPEDADNAKEAAQIATQYFSDKCPRNSNFQPKYVGDSKPVPQIEIWVFCG